MTMFIHFFCLCPLSLAMKLNFNISKVVYWYHGRHGMDFSRVGWDLGTPPSQRYGCTGVGAIPYITNCNVTIDNQDLDLGREIASGIRASSPGGLAGVQSMAFRHEGRVEIACNVEA